MAAAGSILKFVEWDAAAQTPQRGAVNRKSAPSQLRITDMRACRIADVLDFPNLAGRTWRALPG